MTPRSYADRKQRRADWKRSSIESMKSNLLSSKVSSRCNPGYTRGLKVYFFVTLIEDFMFLDVKVVTEFSFDSFYWFDLW